MLDLASEAADLFWKECAMVVTKKREAFVMQMETQACERQKIRKEV